MWFSLTIPYSDTWVLVFSNLDGYTTIYFDVGLDLNDDNEPFYSLSDYDDIVYAQILEPGQYYALHGNFDQNTVLTGQFSTYFTTDGIEFFICDKENFDSWKDGDYAVKYDRKYNYHVAYIDYFSVPHAGDWYLVFSAEDADDTVTFSAGVNIDTSNAVTTTTTTTNAGSTYSSGTTQSALTLFSSMLIGIAALVGFVVIFGLYNMTVRKHGQSTTPLSSDFAKSDEQVVSTTEAASTRDLVLGALKSYPRVSMTELSEILNLPTDVVRRATLFLIASGEIKGVFDKDTDEFTSMSASEAGRELRRDATAELDLPRCPNCGAPFTRSFVVGD
ncbi:MAG: hypothetical protein ACTSYL_10775, partial [Candidatus Thorarchaeota archaeon]